MTIIRRRNLNQINLIIKISTETAEKMRHSERSMVELIVFPNYRSAPCVSPLVKQFSSFRCIDSDSQPHHSRFCTNLCCHFCCSRFDKRCSYAVFSAVFSASLPVFCGGVSVAVFLLPKSPLSSLSDIWNKDERLGRIPVHLHWGL